MKRHHWLPAKLAFAGAALPLLAVAASAQIAVSANDNKMINVDGKNVIVQNAPADTATIIDLGAKPPKVIGEVKAPASVVGPPQSVAISRDESFALVTGAIKIDPADPKKTTANNQVSVIDLKAKPPAVIATVEAGAAPSGLSINPAGTLALVANRNDGTLSIFTIANKTLTAAGKVDFGNPKFGPSHVAFTPDGKMALVFHINGTKLTLAAKAESGAWGRGVVWSKDGKTLLAQSMADKSIDVFSFTGKALKKTGTIKVNGGAAGIRTALD